MSMTITLVNSGPGPCWLDGYPKLRLVAVTGAAVPFRQAYAGQYIRKIPPSRVLLEVGAIAYVEIAKYRCDLGVARSASQVQLILPETGKGIGVSIPTRTFSYCKGGPSDPGNVIAFTPIGSTLGAAQP